MKLVKYSAVAFIFLITSTPITTAQESGNKTLPSVVPKEGKILEAFLQSHCVKCHGPKKQEGKLRLDTLVLPISSSEQTQRWRDVYLALKDGKMPPEEAPQPQKDDRSAVVTHLKSTLQQATKRFGPGYQYKSGDIEIAVASPDEPKVERFNADTILAAVKYLDDGAVAWTRSRRCITCHTNGTYMVERPSLTAYFGKPNEEVLRLFQRGVPSVRPMAKTTESEGQGEKASDSSETSPTKQSRPRPAYTIIWQALGLAQWDKHVVGETSEVTDRALRAMLMQQRDDGSWMHYQGVRELPHISTDFELAVRAAWAISSAPDWFDELDNQGLSQRVERMKTYLREHRPQNDYELALKLQTANFMPDAISEKHRDAAVAMLRRKQNDDGGWSTRSMSSIEKWANWHPQKDKQTLEMLRGESDTVKSASDPYMTGFAIVLLRESGIAKSDEQIQRGLDWLKTNQRQSGRWWMKSMFKETYHFATYMGTAQALKALALCEELEATSPANDPVSR